MENIKTSKYKEESIKHAARVVVKYLIENPDKYKVVFTSAKQEGDDGIITCFEDLHEVNPEVHFFTQDFLCYLRASTRSKNKEVCHLIVPKEDNYKGYLQVDYRDQEDIYDIIDCNINPLNLLPNEYLLIGDEEVSDAYVYDGSKYQRIESYDKLFRSKYLSKVTPKDLYQAAAFDCVQRNQISVLRGPAGSGKSLIAMSWLFNQLERKKIDKIVIFCNPVATKDSARLGFYPGEKNSKLLDSQVGNFLVSKLGSQEKIDDLLASGKLLLLPLSDIRGFDSTNLKAGIYITEAQNMDINLMKLAVQRVGKDSICVIEGDDTAQVDLSTYEGGNNGLRRLSEVFRGHDCYGEVTLKNIYRSKIALIAEEM